MSLLAVKPRITEDVQRFSNNQEPDFTDEEVLCIYLFGLLQRRFTVKEIHRYMKEHWAAWFPALPRYEAYNHRLTRLSALLPSLLTILQQALPCSGMVENVQMIDSMPIILARASRADSAKVTREIADKGYCATTDFYHGLEAECAERNNTIWAVQPRVRGKATLSLFEHVRNTSISRMRQPIESWFAWLQEKTRIDKASKARSTKGLLVHALDRLAAALIALVLNF